MLRLKQETSALGYTAIGVSTSRTRLSRRKRAWVRAPSSLRGKKMSSRYLSELTMSRSSPTSRVASRPLDIAGSWTLAVNLLARVSLKIANSGLFRLSSGLSFRSSSTMRGLFEAEARFEAPDLISWIFEAPEKKKLLIYENAKQSIFQLRKL